METIKQSADMEKRTSFMEEASKGELKIGGQAVEEGKSSEIFLKPNIVTFAAIKGGVLVPEKAASNK